MIAKRFGKVVDKADGGGHVNFADIEGAREVDGFTTGAFLVEIDDWTILASSFDQAF